MAKVVLGYEGHPYPRSHPVKIHVNVSEMNLDVDESGLQVVCHPKQHEGKGFPIKINLTRDEATQLGAEIMARLVGMVVEVPKTI